MKLHRSFTLTTIQSSVEMSILARAGLLLAFVPSIMASTDCEMSGTAWDNDMECTGAGTGSGTGRSPPIKTDRIQETPPRLRHPAFTVALVVHPPPREAAAL